MSKPHCWLTTLPCGQSPDVTHSPASWSTTARPHPTDVATHTTTATNIDATNRNNRGFNITLFSSANCGSPDPTFNPPRVPATPGSTASTSAGTTAAWVAPWR